MYSCTNIDWAERVRSLLYLNSPLVLHQAETEEFFSSLLVPWVHYIPFDIQMKNLATNLRYSLKNEKMMKSIVNRQIKFAQKFLMEESFLLYWEKAIEKFSEIQNKE